MNEKQGHAKSQPRKLRQVAIDPYPVARKRQDQNADSDLLTPSSLHSLLELNPAVAQQRWGDGRGHVWARRGLRID